MAQEPRIYQEIEPVEVEDAEAALERNDHEELLLVVIGVGLYSEDLAWAEDLCLRLARHPHYNVRGNAILSFGYLARRFKTLSRPESIEAVRSGLTDAEEYVRGQAYAAADDIEWYAKLKVRPQAPPESRSASSRAWDAVVGLFMVAVGVPIQIIVAGLVAGGFAAILSLTPVHISESWAWPFIGLVFLLLNAAAFVDWWFRRVEGKVTSRSQVFYLTPRGICRIITGHELPPHRRVG